jgi:hypothetical protein
MNFLTSILKSHRNYARIVGIILFAVGLLGFAFRSSASLPTLYLLACLALGFWGILVSFNKDNK